MPLDSTDDYIYLAPDFFTDGHWDRLPAGWTNGLSQLAPPDLAFLLDSSLPIPYRKDLPLSLLAFRESTHALSLNRQIVDLENYQVGEGLFSADSDKERKAIVSPDSGITIQTQARADIQYGQYLPLNACFRANVKPKKQHEILQLGKAIQLLGSQCGCVHVVDVGAGKGHLSRLLAFGYGFKVTTVEAAGCHAPKAQKMDRAIQKKIHRKLKRKHQTDQDLHVDTNSVESSKEDPTVNDKTPLCMPDHVTCLIQPGTSAGKFLEVVKDSYKKQTDCSEFEEIERVPNEVSSNRFIGSKSKDSESCPNNLDWEKRFGTSYTKKDFINSLNIPSNSVNVDTTIIQSKEQVIILADDNPRPGCSTCDVEPTQSDSLPDELSRTSLSVPSDQTKSTLPKSTVPVDLTQFVLTGLHACGDLTPTMLRIFTQCPNIVGLASVACCYMKLSCTGEGTEDNTDDVGYPMSQFTRNISDSHLSYEAREMACHFADSYKERLIANPPSLKLHCYRAALQYIIKQTYPDFNHGSIRLTIKHAENLSFESYVKSALGRLGLDTDVKVQVMQQAKSYLPYLQNVVAFYTLRLSLAPVVESLILLDRMLYLYEQGIPSVLLPIFDPALSPRNFVLLASRKKSTDIKTS
ncbi:protein RRNAD1-like isoform X2 [Pecten maximus]|uniref:protein RRNAD1-like isoform X2 n=1 Tax=Pecten maximus TaxID=6579 RepID=UPI001458060E|nr:protein RRNAD1-like isoform X2 [Pecten maximus]